MIDDSLKWQKYRDIRKAYKQCVWQGWHNTRRSVFNAVVKKPYPSFYITADYCAKMFRWKERGCGRIESMRPPTRRMLEHLYKRYLEVRKEKPDATIIEICTQIVDEPAPELFMTGDSAYNFYLEMQKREMLLRQLKQTQNT